MMNVKKNYTILLRHAMQRFAFFAIVDTRHTHIHTDTQTLERGEQKKNTHTKPLKHAHCFVCSILLLLFFCCYRFFSLQRCTTFLRNMRWLVQNISPLLAMPHSVNSDGFFHMFFFLHFIISYTLLDTCDTNQYQLILFTRTHTLGPKIETHSKRSSANIYTLYTQFSNLFRLCIDFLDVDDRKNYRTIQSSEHYLYVCVILFVVILRLPIAHPMHLKTHFVFVLFVAIRCTNFFYQMCEFWFVLSLLFFTVCATIRFVESKINFTRLVTHCQILRKK